MLLTCVSEFACASLLVQTEVRTVEALQASLDETRRGLKDLEVQNDGRCMAAELLPA